MKRSKYVSLLFLPALIGCTNRYTTADYHYIPHDSLVKLCIRETYPYDTIPCDLLTGMTASPNEYQNHENKTYHRIGSPERREVMIRNNIGVNPETQSYSIYSSSDEYPNTIDGGGSGYYSSHSNNTVYYLNSADRHADISRRSGFGARASSSSSSYSRSGGGFSSGS